MIEKFDGKYRFLSNFFGETFTFEGRVWKSVEHAYQAYKFFPNEEMMDRIANAPTASMAKKLGKQKGIRSDWDECKIDIMTKLVRRKFESSYYLRSLLIKTNDEELVEGNWWGDTFWGKCYGNGENHLGKILMKIRDEIKESQLK